MPPEIQTPTDLPRTINTPASGAPLTAQTSLPAKRHKRLAIFLIVSPFVFFTIGIGAAFFVRLVLTKDPAANSVQVAVATEHISPLVQFLNIVSAISSVLGVLMLLPGPIIGIYLLSKKST